MPKLTSVPAPPTMSSAVWIAVGAPAALSTAKSVRLDYGVTGTAIMAETAWSEREARWAHLLCGEPVLLATGAAAPSGEAGVAAGEIAALRAEVTRLATDLEALRAELAAVKGELGLS